MRRASYHHDDPNSVDVTEVDLDRHVQNQEDQQHALQHAPHGYYDPTPYHYLTVPQQPLIDHHVHQQHPHQHHQVPPHHHQQQLTMTVDAHQHHQRPLVDPAWHANVTNDAYLHMDPTAVDYHLHHAAPAAPLEDMMLPPPPQAPMMAAPAAASVAARASTQALSLSKRRSTTSRARKRTPKSSVASPRKKRVSSADGGGGPGSNDNYLSLIHQMLENVQKDGNQHIVSWQPHGRAFRIHNETLFIEHVMPRYFKAKIGSFRRWLRAWGFVRMTEGKDRGSWYHRYFVRGVTSLCKNMTRQQMADAMLNWPPSGHVPDFYSAATGSTLSEQLQEHEEQTVPYGTPIATQINHGQDPLAANPKLLRGTVLEDLRQLLDDAETEGHTHIASWMPHGRAFKIHNKALFQGLMVRYFRTNKISHLNDTLRLWGFRRLKKSVSDKGAMFHIKFVKGDPALSRHLTRVHMKACMENWPPPEGEPDLYIQPAAAATNPGGIQTIPGAAGLHPALHGGYAQAAYPRPPNLAAREQARDSSRSSGGDGTYIKKLHEMLEDAEKDGNQRIVSWMPHGRAFRVHQEDEFVEQIMPKYFKAKMKSFLRWCRAWGFVRMTEGPDRGAWYHRYFVRGVTSLSRNMTRQQMLKAMEDWLPPGHVPNFYASGTGEVLSETRQEPLEPPPNVTCKNPKQLRGTVPEDLRQMLLEAELEGNTRIVGWLEHGRAFKVFDKARFCKEILPRYFKATKYSYFSDALRMWGWHRLKQEGESKNAYYHRLFIRGQPQLTRHLTRTQMKASMAPWPPLEGEPDLYAPPPPPNQTDAQEGNSTGGFQTIDESPAAAMLPAPVGPAVDTAPIEPTTAPDADFDTAVIQPTAAPDTEFEDSSELKDSNILWQTAV